MNINSTRLCSQASRARNKSKQKNSHDMQINKKNRVTVAACVELRTNHTYWILWQIISIERERKKITFRHGCIEHKFNKHQQQKKSMDFFFYKFISALYSITYQQKLYKENRSIEVEKIFWMNWKIIFFMRSIAFKKEALKKDKNWFFSRFIFCLVNTGGRTFAV